MKLTSDHLPIPSSLIRAVVARHAPTRPAANSATLGARATIACLKGIDNGHSGLLDAIRSKTEGDTDAAQPSREHQAVLSWLEETHQLWEEQFPLETELSTALRQLLPLAGALAIEDDTFMMPGTHPLHQLLDAIQSSAIGWHPGLGRAGQTIQKQINTAIADARAWFDEQDTELGATLEKYLTLCLRDHARLERMTQRVVESEQGRLKATRARYDAAQMINAVLVQYRAPDNIGEFLKGPWYDSAQLVLLKFGSNSPQWEEMSGITGDLLESLRARDNSDEEQRQILFEAASKIPKQLTKWLYSMHLDDAAVGEAVAAVEVAHLRLMRDQPLDMHSVDPLPIELLPEPTPASEELEHIAALETGQWFVMEDTAGESVRVQLALKLDDEQQLIFINQAGVKAHQAGYQQFWNAMASGKVVLLQSGASYSSCLAWAAGIDSVEALEQFLARPEPEPEPEPEREPEPEPESEPNPAATSESENPELTDEAPSAVQHSERPLEINIPMGSWLGFHDGDTPMMAKLAVHDREQDNYIFVDREGIKIRDVKAAQMIELIQSGLVDVLETSSSLKDEINRAREEHLRG